MALVQISDVIVPEVFTDYVQLLTTQKSAFIRSGVVEMSPLLDQLLAGGGQTFNIPHFNDLADTESNVSSDEGIGVNDAVPLKTTTGQEIAVRHSRNQNWSSADLSAALAGADPMESIASRVADYWVRQAQSMLIATIQGVIADNEANDSGDMVNVISLAAGGTPTAANLFSAEAFIDTVQTMGDFGEDLVAVSMHSVVYRRAQKNNLIDFIPDARGEVDIPTFLGRRVIVDDGMPAVANTGNIDYSTYLYGAGSIAAGVGTPRVATEISREPLAGAGGGQELLHNRVEWLYHPRGTAFLVAGIAGQSPTFAELAAAAQWDRRFERKLVKIAELRTNG